MFHAAYQRIIIVTALLIAVLGLGGCGADSPVWVDNGGAYSSSSVDSVLGVADTARYVDRPTGDAPALRHKALTSLRKNGQDAAIVATLLTSTFDPETRGVPVYVEEASVDGTAAVIVVEATGPKSGTLGSKRLWVLTRNGDVILARGK